MPRNNILLRRLAMLKKSYTAKWKNIFCKISKGIEKGTTAKRKNFEKIGSKERSEKA